MRGPGYRESPGSLFFLVMDETECGTPGDVVPAVPRARATRKVREHYRQRHRDVRLVLREPATPPTAKISHREGSGRAIARW